MDFTTLKTELPPAIRRRRTVSLPNNFGGRVSLLYPTDLGIKLECSSQAVELRFPRPYLAAILEVTKYNHE